jgi:multiple sugar transport system ATP-binding protein
VAGFIGSPPMNLFKGCIRCLDTRLTFVETNPGGKPVTVPLSDALARRAERYIDQPIIFGVRPEDVREGVDATASSSAAPEATIEVAEPMGAETYLYLTTGATSVIARVRPTEHFRIGQQIKINFDLEKAHLFDPATEQIIPS